MGWIDLELVLISLAAMLSPTTLTFSVLAVVLAKRPLRTGVWFYLGAFLVTIAIGILAAFVLGDVAAPSSGGGRKTWVSVFDLVAGVALFVYVARTWRTPDRREDDEGHGREDELRRLVSVDRRLRCGCDAREPRRFHPARAQGDLRARPVAVRLCRGLALLHAHVAASRSASPSC